MGAAAAVVGHWEWGPVPNGGGVFFWYRLCVYPGRKEGTIALTHERGIRGDILVVRASSPTPRRRLVRTRWTVCVGVRSKCPSRYFMCVLASTVRAFFAGVSKGEGAFRHAGVGHCRLHYDHSFPITPIAS